MAMIASFEHRRIWVKLHWGLDSSRTLGKLNVEDRKRPVVTGITLEAKDFLCQPCLHLALFLVALVGPLVAPQQRRLFGRGK